MMLSCSRTANGTWEHWLPVSAPLDTGRVARAMVNNSSTTQPNEQFQSETRGSTKHDTTPGATTVLDAASWRGRREGWGQCIRACMLLQCFCSPETQNRKMAWQVPDGGCSSLAQTLLRRGHLFLDVLAGCTVDQDVTGGAKEGC